MVKLLHHTLDFLLSYDFDLVLFHVKVASLREDFEYRGTLTRFHVEEPDVVLWRLLERLDQLPVFVVLVKRIPYVHPGDSIALLHFDRNAEQECFPGTRRHLRLHSHITAIICSLIDPVRRPRSVLLHHIRRGGGADTPLLAFVLLSSLDWRQFTKFLLHRVRVLLNYRPLMHLFFIIPRCFATWWFVFPPFCRGIHRSTPWGLTMLLFGNKLMWINLHRLWRRFHAISFIIIVHIGSSLLSMSRTNLFHKPILDVNWSRHLVVRLCICCVYTSGWSNSLIEERPTSCFEATVSFGG